MKNVSYGEAMSNYEIIFYSAYKGLGRMSTLTHYQCMRTGKAFSEFPLKTAEGLSGSRCTERSRRHRPLAEKSHLASNPLFIKGGGGPFSRPDAARYCMPVHPSVNKKLAREQELLTVMTNTSTRFAVACPLGKQYAAWNLS